MIRVKQGGNMWDAEEVSSALTEAVLTGYPSLKISWGHFHHLAVLATPDGRIYREMVRARGKREVWWRLGLPSSCVALTRKTVAKKARAQMQVQIIMWAKATLAMTAWDRPAWLQYPIWTVEMDAQSWGMVMDRDLGAYALADALEEEGDNDRAELMRRTDEAVRIARADERKAWGAYQAQPSTTTEYSWRNLKARADELADPATRVEALLISAASVKHRLQQG